MKTKMMFINAIDATDKIATSVPPLGLGYLASSLRKEFGQDSILFKIVDRAVEQEIQEFKPDIVGISSVSQNYNRAMEYAGTAKKYGLPVMIGGIHISALPATMTNDMDVAVIGEGEEAIIDLFRLFAQKSCFDKKKLAGIRGIAFKKEHTLVVTEKRTPIEPLDKIPMPARDLFTVKDSASLFTSRGCPYRCTFCASCRFWGKVRFFSAEYVANEIKVLVHNYKVREISFFDDLFVADKARLERILALLKKDAVIGKVRFTCNARSNVVTEELGSLLKEMNVKSVGMGFESGSVKTLEYLKGKNISLETHKNSLEIFRKHGIEPHASFIIGSPYERREDILQTLAFIEENRLSSFDLYVLSPFPGTPVWDYAKARELVNENMNWDSLNVNFKSNCDKAIILSEKLTRDQIRKLFMLFMKVKKKLRKRIKRRNALGRLKTLLKKRTEIFRTAQIEK